MADSTYTQSYSNFIGTDMSSDPRVVSRNRLAYSVNMWRDYESNQGAAIETFPGFRKIIGLTNKKINGMWAFTVVSSLDVKLNTTYIIVHAGTNIYAFPETDARYGLCLENANYYSKEVTINDNPSTAFVSNNRLYILDGSNLVEVYQGENDNVLARIKINADGLQNTAYVPTTYCNGKPCEQRNGFSNKVIEAYSSGGTEGNLGESRVFNLLEKFTPDDGNNTGGIITVYVDDVDIKTLTITKDVEGVPEPVQEKGSYNVLFKEYEEDGSTLIPYAIEIDKKWIYNKTYDTYKTVKIERKIDATSFNTIGDLKQFNNDKMTMPEAILGCTKSAVYDGRVFLTGNPKLPNTVFYSQRNLTGANDPTYFGVYNYFNDGDGNTPNVDLLSTPSMLMVIKGDTTQDGSVYYHVGADNPHSEKSVRDLVPRVYPSTQGAAGLGSAGTTEAYSLSCNFLDDPVFLGRGLEGVSKEQLNAERTIGHRSSNVDRLLRKENLSHASLAEWKGYLVICCNGHIYLADSRAVSKHQDGSYQYEWFYLQDVGTYENYEKAYETITSFPLINDLPLGEYLTRYDGDKKVSDEYSISASVINVPESKIRYNTAYSPNALSFADSVSFYSYESDDGRKYVVSENESQKFGSGKFYGARRVLADGDLLFFATDYDICVFNTDKRGVPVNKDEDDIWESDKIDSSWYTFNGVPYKSACALRLDDCDKKSLTKTTIYGTTVARLKMMPGSRCKIKSSTNGRDWIDVAEAYSTRMDFSDLRFDNMAFTENEDNVTVIREVSRGWVQKQYYFESDGFCEPFGLYELSYIYKIAGKIRYY